MLMTLVVQMNGRKITFIYRYLMLIKNFCKEKRAGVRPTPLKKGDDLTSVVEG